MEMQKEKKIGGGGKTIYSIDQADFEGFFSPQKSEWTSWEGLRYCIVPWHLETARDQASSPWGTNMF